MYSSSSALSCRVCVGCDRVDWNGRINSGRGRSTPQQSPPYLSPTHAVHHPTPIQSTPIRRTPRRCVADLDLASRKMEMTFSHSLRKTKLTGRIRKSSALPRLSFGCRCVVGLVNGCGWAGVARLHGAHTQSELFDRTGRGRSPLPPCRGASGTPRPVIFVFCVCVCVF